MRNYDSAEMRLIFVLHNKQNTKQNDNVTYLGFCIGGDHSRLWS